MPSLMRFVLKCDPVSGFSLLPAPAVLPLNNEYILHQTRIRLIVLFFSLDRLPHQLKSQGRGENSLALFSPYRQSPIITKGAQ